MTSGEVSRSDIDQGVAEIFIDVEPVGPHRGTPKIERGDAGPGFEGPEYDEMVSHMEERLQGKKPTMTQAILYLLDDSNVSKKIEGE